MAGLLEPGGRQQQVCQQRGVAVRGARVRGLAGREEARGVGEDVVVDVGVFERGGGVLVEAVEEEEEPQEEGDEEEGEGVEEGVEL